MNKEEIPQHIAIIMDGNGRWAKIRNENRIQGHIKAKKSVRESIEFCVEKKIKYLTLFAFSTENWKRPKLEVQALMNLLNNVISDELNTLKNQNIKLKVIGDLSPLPKKTKESLELAINETSKNKGLCLILAINYSGKWDIFNATKKILETKQKLDLANFNEKVFEKNLSTYNIPDPELIIRTSGEERISNFYLWQAAYSELYFTDILWPDFNKNDFDEALMNFFNRKRKFGVETG